MSSKTLGDIAEIQTGPFGSQLHNKDYVLEGTPIVTVEHLGKRRFTMQNMPFVSESDASRLSKYRMRPGDIIFSRVGSVDKCSYALDQNDGWLFSGRCLRVRPNEEIDSKCLYYYISSPAVQRYVRSIAVGATMPSINTSLLSEVPVNLPESFEVQKRIGHVLSMLDSRIEINQQLNDYLAA